MQQQVKESTSNSRLRLNKTHISSQLQNKSKSSSCRISNMQLEQGSVHTQQIFLTAHRGGFKDTYSAPPLLLLQPPMYDTPPWRSGKVTSATLHLYHSPQCSLAGFRRVTRFKLDACHIVLIFNQTVLIQITELT